MATIDNTASKMKIFLGNGATTAFTLPVSAEFVNDVVVTEPNTAAYGFTTTAYTATNAAASATNVNFAGTPTAPDVTLTFETAPTANSLVFVSFLPAGTL